MLDVPTSTADERGRRGRRRKPEAGVAPSGPGAQAAATTEGYIADALAMSVCDVVDQRDRESPDTVFDLFRAAVCQLGYDRVALVPVTPAARQALGITELDAGSGVQRA